MAQTESDQFSESPEPKSAKPGSRGRSARISATAAMLAGLIALSAGGLFYMHLTTRSFKIVAATPADQAIQSFLGGGQGNLKKLLFDVESTRSIVEQFKVTDADTRLTTAHDLDDPFVYVRQQALEAETSQLAVAQPKSESRNRALESARKLQLQSILHGSSRRACLINGQICFEGQQIDQFQIEAISADAVVVRSGEYRFELRMKK